MSFIHENFLLESRTARRLYHEFAEAEPILDYHCHLSPRDLAEDRQFRNLFEIWLEGDHYKWRAMRANGIPERFCTGTAEPYAKFEAWAATVPWTLRNPLHHWTHLELKRYFGVSILLDRSSAAGIWKRANRMLASPELSARGILKRFKVRTLCTTDDPADDLRHHRALADAGLTRKVLPTFRPDKALAVNQPGVFKQWLGELEKVSDVETRRFGTFLEALRSRHDYFHAQGCRLSDHGLGRCPSEFCSEKRASESFRRTLQGRAATAEEHTAYASFMMLYFGHLDAARGWTKQLHLGALRNNNTRALECIGPDAGFDSIGDFPQAASLAAYLDRLEKDNALPKTIIYNSNPSDNYLFGAMIGNFQDGSIPAKVQLGSGWWFLDQREGMEWQLNTLSNLGLLSRFVGMVTDSRSFMSYPRHEYFRRTLCNLLGRDVERGLLPGDMRLLGRMIVGMCYRNAVEYFDFGKGRVED
jgi:glucuronate isomerase